MIPKQDRQGVRQAKDIEQKYDLNKDFSAIEKLAANANKTAQSAQSAANNAATLAEEVNTSLEAFAKSTTAQFESVNSDISELSESISTDIHNLDERMTDLENSDFDGEDGFSPTVELSKSGGVTTLTITDKNGTKTATINDGADGYTPVKGVDYVDGKDGYTPVKGVDYVDGKDGYTPVKGVDYTDGKDGNDATINGVNTLTIEAGDNIEIEQVGNVLKIRSTASGGGSFEALTIEEIRAICHTPDEHTLLLLHGENIADSSQNAVPITNSGVSVSNAQSKFGGSSLYFDGSSFLSVGNSSMLNGNQFTIDWWEYRTSATAWSTTFSQQYAEGNNAGFVIGGNTGTGIDTAYISSNGSDYDVASQAKIGNTTINAWVHRAIVRNGNQILAFENGTLINTIPVSVQFAYSGAFVLGKHNNCFIGYIDEFRISDVARWTAEFTPPTEQYK